MLQHHKKKTFENVNSGFIFHNLLTFYRPKNVLINQATKSHWDSRVNAYVLVLVLREIFQMNDVLPKWTQDLRMA